MNPQVLCHQIGRRLVFWEITITARGSEHHLCFHWTENPVAAVLNNSKSHQLPLTQLYQLRVMGEAFSWHEEWHRGRGTQKQRECTCEAESFSKWTPSFPRGYVGSPGYWLKPAVVQPGSQSFSIPMPATVSSLFPWSSCTEWNNEIKGGDLWGKSASKLTLWHWPQW